MPLAGPGVDYSLLPIREVRFAERFASQFGTQEARDHMLEGLKQAGFR